MGSVGSASRICSRTAVVMRAGSPATRIVKPVLSIGAKEYGT
jgi:predicted transcriptional regulator